MANQEVVSSASGSATIMHQGVQSNAPGGPALDRADPPSTTAVYEGQKVPIKIETSDLSGGNYTTVKFIVAVDDELNPLKNDDAVTGTAVHPDSMAKLTQAVVDGQSDYGIDLVIVGKSGENATWNVSITGQGNPPPKEKEFKPNIFYTTQSANIDTLWGYQFLPPGKQVTPNINNSIHITNYQVKSGKQPLAYKFSAMIKLQLNSKQADLTCLNFFDKNKTPLTLTADKKTVWIDSDDAGILDFYITANTLETSWSLVTLTMYVGTAAVDLPSLVIVDIDQVPKDAQTFAPQIDGAGSTYQVDTARPIGVIVPADMALKGNIQFGDTLFLVVNDVLLPESGRQYTTENKDVIANNEPFFTISPSLLNYSSDGGDNSLLYLVVRTVNGAVKSSEYSFTAYGEGGPAEVVPPFPVSDHKYAALQILNFPSGSTFDSDDVTAGLTARIKWAHWQEASWKPLAGDQFTIYCLIAAYDRFHTFTPIILPIQSRVLDDDDINSKGYIDTTIQSPSLVGWYIGDNYEKSTIVFQFLNPRLGDYSEPTGQYILATLAAGGV